MEGGLVANAILWAPPTSPHTAGSSPFLGPFLLFPGFHDGLMVVCLKGATAERGRAGCLSVEPPPPLLSSRTYRPPSLSSPTSPSQAVTNSLCNLRQVTSTWPSVSRKSKKELSQRSQWPLTSVSPRVP